MKNVKRKNGNVFIKKPSPKSYFAQVAHYLIQVVQQFRPNLKRVKRKSFKFFIQALNFQILYTFFLLKRTFYIFSHFICLLNRANYQQTLSFRSIKRTFCHYTTLVRPYRISPPEKFVCSRLWVLYTCCPISVCHFIIFNFLS